MKPTTTPKAKAKAQSRSTDRPRIRSRSRTTASAARSGPSDNLIDRSASRSLACATGDRARALNRIGSSCSRTASTTASNRYAKHGTAAKAKSSYAVDLHSDNILWEGKVLCLFEDTQLEIVSNGHNYLGMACRNTNEIQYHDNREWKSNDVRIANVYRAVEQRGAWKVCAHEARHKNTIAVGFASRKHRRQMLAKLALATALKVEDRAVKSYGDDCFGRLCAQVARARDA